MTKKNDKKDTHPLTPEEAVEIIENGAPYVVPPKKEKEKENGTATVIVMLKERLRKHSF